MLPGLSRARLLARAQPPALHTSSRNTADRLQPGGGIGADGGAGTGQQPGEGRDAVSSQLPAAASPFTKRSTRKGGGCTPLPATLTPSPFLSPLLSLPPFGQGLELKHSSHRCRGGKAAYPKGFLQLFQPTEQFSLQSEPAAWPPQPLRAARFGAKQPPTMGGAQGLEVKEGGMGSLRASPCLCRAFKSLARDMGPERHAG